MKLLPIITQLETGQITRGIIRQRSNHNEEEAVLRWAAHLHEAGILVSHVCYGKGQVWSNWHCKTPLAIDLEAY